MVTERPTVADTEDGLIHVLIVDDHQMFAASLARVLNDEPDISVLATVESAVEAFEAMSEEIDVVLVDFRLGRSDGIETTRTLVASWPNVRVVMLTASNRNMASTAIPACFRSDARKMHSDPPRL